MWWKIAILFLVGGLLYGAESYWTYCAQPEVMAGIGVSQMERSDEAASTMRFASNASQDIQFFFILAFVATAILLFWRDVVSLIKVIQHKGKIS